jgi:hypothetical protein
MKNEVTMQSEWKRRMDLIENPKFRALCIENVKKLGITAQEWNENKAGILMYFANEFCGYENNLTK